MIFTCPAVLTRIAYLKDRGLSLGFSTNELTDQEKVIAGSFHGKFGWLCFSENQIAEADIPKGPAEDSAKTPSQRLRAVLFVYWKQLGESGDFEDFYRKQVDRIIDAVKAKLD